MAAEWVVVSTVAEWVVEAFMAAVEWVAADSTVAAEWVVDTVAVVAAAVTANSSAGLL